MKGRKWGTGVLVVNCFAVCFLPVPFLSGDHTSSSPVDKHPNQLTTQHATPPRRLLPGGVLPCQGLKDRIPVQLNPTNPEPRGKQVLACFLPPATPPRFAQASKHLPSHTPGTFPRLRAPAPGTQNRVSSPSFPLPAPCPFGFPPQCLALGLLGNPGTTKWVGKRIFLHPI